MEKDVKREEITLARSSSSLRELRTFIRDALSRTRLGEYDRGLVALAVDEVVSAMVDSPGESSAATIGLQIDISNVAVKVEIEDSENHFGNGLNDEAALAEARKSKNRREIAVYFICEIMDEIYYTYQRGFENRLVMVKFLE